MDVMDKYIDRDELERETPWEQPCWYCLHSNAVECPWFDLPAKPRKDWDAVPTKVSLYDKYHPDLFPRERYSDSYHIVHCRGFERDNSIIDLDSEERRKS